VTLSSALVAFAFAYFRFPYRNQVFGLVLATMMLPGAVLMIPQFLIWDYLGFNNTLVPLWAGNLFGSAFYIFMLRQFFLSLPNELFEAARVDGASYPRMWWSVALPLTRSALIVVFIFELKVAWTDLVRPLIFLRDVQLFTLPRGLKAIIDSPSIGGQQQWELLAAGSVLVTVPMILIFFFFQRYFIEGIATTGTTGK
jgi:multiple sugar transport system permease protein